MLQLALEQETETELVSELSACDRANVEELLFASAGPAYQQYPEWPDAVKDVTGFEYAHLMTFRGGRLIGYAAVRKSASVGKYWLATTQRGPIVAQHFDHLKEVVISMAEALKKAGAYTWQLAPRAWGRNIALINETLRELGAAPLAYAQQSLHIATGLVDLEGSEEEILAGFSQSGRRRIRQAEKAGVELRQVQSSQDLEAFDQVVAEFANARSDYKVGLPRAAEQQAVIAKYGGAMQLAYCQGELIGASSFIKQGDEAITLTLASNGKQPKAQGNAMMVWQEILSAREMGCTAYDFAGMPIDEPKDHGEARRMQFKRSFSPQKRILVPMHTLVLHQVMHSFAFRGRQFLKGIR